MVDIKRRDLTAYAARRFRFARKVTVEAYSLLAPIEPLIKRILLSFTASRALPVGMGGPFALGCRFAALLLWLFLCKNVHLTRKRS